MIGHFYALLSPPACFPPSSPSSSPPPPFVPPPPPPPPIRLPAMFCYHASVLNKQSRLYCESSLACCYHCWRFCAYSSLQQWCQCSRVIYESHIQEFILRLRDTVCSFKYTWRASYLCPSAQELARDTQQKRRIAAIYEYLLAGMSLAPVSTTCQRRQWHQTSRLSWQTWHQILQSERANRPAWQHPWEVFNWLEGGSERVCFAAVGKTRDDRSYHKAICFSPNQASRTHSISRTGCLSR